jgi:hypothetical protein
VNGGRQKIVVITFMISLSVCACAYPQRRWQEFKKDFAKELQRTAAQPKSAEEACQRRGGVLYQEQCYTPTTATVDAETCRLRGGLYVDERCLVAPQGNTATARGQ